MEVHNAESLLELARRLPIAERLRLAAMILNDMAQDIMQGSEASDATEPANVWRRLRELAKEAADTGVKLPPDLAERHDYYLYGVGRDEDEEDIC